MCGVCQTIQETIEGKKQIFCQRAGNRLCGNRGLSEN